MLLDKSVSVRSYFPQKSDAAVDNTVVTSLGKLSGSLRTCCVCVSFGSPDLVL